MRHTVTNSARNSATNSTERGFTLLEIMVVMGLLFVFLTFRPGGLFSRSAARD